MRYPKEIYDNADYCSLYVGQTILWLVVDHSSHEVRREALDTLKRVSGGFPKPTGVAIRLAISHLLFEEKRESETTRHRVTRLSTALAVSAQPTNLDDKTKEQFLTQLLLVCHHSDFSK